MAEFFNRCGHLYSPALTSDWPRPQRVELRDGNLTIWGNPADRKRLPPRKFARPEPGLLESFLALVDPPGRMLPLSSMLKGDGGGRLSDRKIRRFAERYGGLQIFYRQGRESARSSTVHTESCALWRYFAGVMRALLRIGAAQYEGKPGSPEDWLFISALPSDVRAATHRQDRRLLDPAPLSDEENWVALTHFAAKKQEHNPAMVALLLNTLLGLGRVRPWITWPDPRLGGGGPQFTYAGGSLLSSLALQLCLLMAKVEAWAVCFHCHKFYRPPGRAPKTGQRTFCLGCREKGMPKYYAHRDFRQRKRRAAKS